MLSVQYVIVLDKPMRIGLEIIEAIGPFETIDAAKFWYAMEASEYEIPSCNLKTIHHANQIIGEPLEQAPPDWRFAGGQTDE